MWGLQHQQINFSIDEKNDCQGVQLTFATCRRRSGTAAPPIFQRLISRHAALTTNTSPPILNSLCDPFAGMTAASVSCGGQFRGDTEKTMEASAMPSPSRTTFMSGVWATGVADFDTTVDRYMLSDVDAS